MIMDTYIVSQIIIQYLKINLYIQAPDKVEDKKIIMNVLECLFQSCGNPVNLSISSPCVSFVYNNHKLQYKASAVLNSRNE